jgi:anti-anti-sigma factor
VPLYACDRCGFTSAAFRVDAARAHRLEYPDCTGTIQIIFRSEERSRSRNRRPKWVAQQTAPAHAREALPEGTRLEREFEILERSDADGRLHLQLRGDLDVAVAHRLSDRLRELKPTGRPVRLDLSELAFIDSTGMQALLVALTDARWEGWELDVARTVSPSVRRAAHIVGVARALWPEDPKPERADPADDARNT